MNDFTKEELEMLVNIIDSDNIFIQHAANIRHKLQSMIDSYCEHKQHHYYGDLPAGECAECGMVMLP